MSIAHDDETIQIERKADASRARLARTLAALDARRREITEAPMHFVKRYAVPAAIIGGGLILGVVGSAVWGALALRRRLQHPWRERGHALQRAWKHPERVADYKDRPLPVELFRKVVMGAITLVASQLVRRGVHRVLPAPTAHVEKTEGETIVRVTA